MELKSNLKVRLLGDELADRGNNDYFTLKILEKMAESRVPVEVILSNHSVEFIEAYEKRDQFTSPMLNSYFAKSMEYLQYFINEHHVSRKEILEIIRKVYKPILKAISYSLSEDKKEITIHSHAAIGLNTVKSLAKAINVYYRAATTIELAETIDEINKKFQEHVQANTVHTLYTRVDMLKGFKESDKVDLRYTPWVFIMWNRAYNKIFRPAKHSGYKVSFAHGHDSSDPKQEKDHIYNLDNNLGKGPPNNKDVYTVLYTDNSHFPRNQFLTEAQVHEIKKLLYDYLKHLTSYLIVISNQQEVLFREKEDSSVTITQSGVAGILDEARYSKFNKTCELLIKLHKNDGTFQTDVKSYTTNKLLLEHRDNMFIRMLKAIRCILTLNCCAKWSLTHTRGAQAIGEINNILRASLSR